MRSIGLLTIFSALRIVGANRRVEKRMATVFDADIVEVFAPQIEGMVGLRLPSACRSTAVGVDGPRDTDVVRHAFAPA